MQNIRIINCCLNFKFKNIAIKFYITVCTPSNIWYIIKTLELRYLVENLETVDNVFGLTDVDVAERVADGRVYGDQNHKTNPD